MTSLCFAEAWESLRRSIFIEKRSPKKGYLHQSYLLTAYLREGRIKLDEVSLTDPVMFEDVETIVKKYQIDVSDALQIVTIQKGRYRSFVDESQSLLITADKDLAKAARSEGLKTWCCLGGRFQRAEIPEPDYSYPHVQGFYECSLFDSATPIHYIDGIPLS